MRRGVCVCRYGAVLSPNEGKTDVNRMSVVWCCIPRQDVNVVANVVVVAERKEWWGWGMSEKAGRAGQAP